MMLQLHNLKDDMRVSKHRTVVYIDSHYNK